MPLLNANYAAASTIEFRVICGLKELLICKDFAVSSAELKQKECYSICHLVCYRKWT